MRRKTRVLTVGNVKIGGDNPIVVQSMTNTKTENVAATVKQINELAALGCEVIRCAVPTMEAAKALADIKKQVTIPVIADIHFDYKLALEAIRSGVDALRLNPGNIGGRDRVEAVVKAAQERNLPIRIGVNGGSLPQDLLQKYGHPTPEALVEAAWRHIHILEEMHYKNIKISLKAHELEKRFYTNVKTERRYIKFTVRKNEDGVTRVLDYLQKNGVKSRTLNIKEDFTHNTITVELYLKMQQDGDIDKVVAGINDLNPVTAVEIVE